tara:strand:+ start:69 stop:398 length:330 start_codon:yes stop_codon:yes gene_type:complete
MIDFKGEKVRISDLASKHNHPWYVIKFRYDAGKRGDDLITHKNLHKGNKNKAKLTSDDVSEIKLMLLKGELYQKEIANIYGVDQSTISNIKRKRNWGDITIDIELTLET